VLVGIGLTLYLSADLRDEWRKLDSLDQSLREVTERLAAEAPLEAPQPREQPATRAARTRRANTDRQSVHSAAS
jgi:hypothetical protein